MIGWNTFNDWDWHGFMTLTPEQYWTLRYDESPVDYRSVASPLGNTVTGYYSDKAKCSPVPGSLPGRLEGNWWTSHCHNNTRHEITLIELYYNTSIRNNAHGEREAFCDSLTDQGGNKRRPIACGGTDPNVFTYNPGSVAKAEIENALGDVEQEAAEIANELIRSSRTKIFVVALVVLMVIILLILMFK